jgi:hypothetical protein
METTDREPSEAGFKGSWRGMWIGAIAGAILVYLGAWILGVDVAAGGPGLWAMGGAGAGGLAGFFIGAVMSAGSDRSRYRGPERRTNLQPYPGVERRRAPG